MLNHLVATYVSLTKEVNSPTDQPDPNGYF